MSTSQKRPGETSTTRRGKTSPLAASATSARHHPAGTASAIFGKPAHVPSVAYEAAAAAGAVGASVISGAAIPARIHAVANRRRRCGCPPPDHGAGAPARASSIASP
jgi:hypothetical protein